MKAVILAGGLGTRLSEETATMPKPMVEIGGKPIIWHIMKILANYGITDFIVCCGYKGYMIKEYFYNCCLQLCTFKSVYSNDFKCFFAIGCFVNIGKSIFWKAIKNTV